MIKKKAWLMFLSLILVLTLFAVGCSETTSNGGNKTNNGAAVTKNEDQVPIRFEDIKPEIKIFRTR